MNNITVIGIGKLGLGFALLLENIGYNVLGIDIFQDYVDKLNKKIYKTLEPEYENLLTNSKNFKATTSLEQGVNFSDLIFIIVQTPNGGGDKFYDHTTLSNVLEKINTLKNKNKNIIIGCTIMTKYINEHLKPILEELYNKMALTKPKFCFLKPIEAEIVKISLNGFITTKISFANMISDLCDTLGADKFKVLDSIGSDSRIGNKYFKPGYSFGGPCFPRDTKALKQIMDQNNIVSDILDATTLYNQEHIEFQTNQLLNQNLDCYIIENVCYKENSQIPLIEESAKLKIAKQLIKAGKKVIIKDYEPIINEVKKEYGILFEYIIKK